VLNQVFKFKMKVKMFIVLSLIAAIAYAKEKTISHVNVYLPVTDCAPCRKAAINITAFNGCYEW